MMHGFGGQLCQLDKAVLGGGRVDESDAAAGMADARHLIEYSSTPPRRMPKQPSHSRLLASRSRTTTPTCSIRLIFIVVLSEEFYANQDK